MSEFIVHSVPGSPYGRAVLAVLEEKRASYTLSRVAPGTLQSEPHVSRHPFGKVPVLEHGDFMLYETQAIVRYLDRISPSPALTPADPREAARMDQVMNVCDWYVFQSAIRVIGFQRIVLPRVLGGTPDEAAVAAGLPQAQAVFEALGRILGRQSYFAGESLTLADLMVAPHVDFVVETPEWAALTANSGGLIDWLARMNARPSLQATTWEKVAAMA